MHRTWSGPEGSSHTSLCLRVPLFYIFMKTDEEYMMMALKEAEKAAKADEVPVGCVIVRNGEVIAKAHNLRVGSGAVAADSTQFPFGFMAVVFRNDENRPELRIVPARPDFFHHGGRFTGPGKPHQ